MVDFRFHCPFLGAAALAVAASCLLVSVGGLSFVLSCGNNMQLMVGVYSVLRIHRAGMTV